MRSQIGNVMRQVINLALKDGKGDASDPSFCDKAEKLCALDRRGTGTIALARRDAYRTVRTIKLIYG